MLSLRYKELEQWINDPNNRNKVFYNRNDGPCLSMSIGTTSLNSERKKYRIIKNALRDLRALRCRGIFVKDLRHYSTSHDTLVSRSPYIFAHLLELLKNSPLNTATQLVIETFLVNQGEFLITNKKYADVYVNLLNDPIKLFCMDKREELMPYVMKLIRSLLLLETNFKESSSLKKKYDYYTGKVMPYSC